MSLSDSQLRHETRAASTDPEALAARIVAEATAQWRAPAVPGYELRSTLGTGGFGVVHLARHRASGQLVALKVLLPRVAVDPATRRRFRREIEVQARLAHPNVAALYDSGEAGGAFWFTMEYCAGGSLARHVQAAGGRLGLAEAAPLMLDALAGLAAAHRRGIVHRDVKPHNILLARGAGPGWAAKLSDFGLARGLGRSAQPGMSGTAGSWPYLPPEQLIDFREARPATDVWSVAATFHQVLAGLPPREPGAPPTAAPAPVRSRVPELPAAVAQVLDRALHLDPARRYRDAGQLRGALLAALPAGLPGGEA